MHKRDVAVAWAFVIGLCFAMLFVAWATWDLAPSGAARLLLLIGGAIVLIYNTAAILAMLRHYREDREVITNHPSKAWSASSSMSRCWSC